jgi:hypothetical protein
MRTGRRRQVANSAPTVLTLPHAPPRLHVQAFEAASRSAGFHAIITGALAVTTFTLRPNILGEILNAVGVGSVSLAALVMLAVYRGRTQLARGGLLVLLLVTAAEGWSVYRAAFTSEVAADSARSSLFTIVVIAAGLLVLGPQWTIKWFLRFLIAVVLVLSASQLATSLLLVLGISLGPYASIPAGQYLALVHFPLTVDVGQILLGGTNVERFAGLGREPGWMAMWAAIAWFVWPLVGRPRWWGRVILLAGILAPISTAGFGVFVIVLAVSFVARPIAGRSPLFVYARTVTATVLLGAAAWVAVFAPVFGLAAKSTLTATSLDVRNTATASGLDAISRLSLGDVGAPGSINLVAAVAEHGWPFSVLILLALLSPLITARSPVRILPSLLVIVLTLLLAQPIDGSPFPWLIVVALAGIDPVVLPHQSSDAAKPRALYPPTEQMFAAARWQIDYSRLRD